jgi:hypothetical protein
VTRTSAYSRFDLSVGLDHRGASKDSRPEERQRPGRERESHSVADAITCRVERGHIALSQLDRHDAQDVHPFGLVLENLPQLCLGGFLS